ncbi:hypothetical protein NQT72_12700 [Pseudoalteromonas carrageenovora]|uniref:hypothetical protein n=1 Tax=Pseudoalteromonas carrageenovora TaxID=227 RepID=UPI00211835CF|nr:hypothetical protein [Pseudoalteromonas carrageenovora]MCQ8890361.1 hypothetical protein [Pseudoalteromonas carrageenovora]
MNKQELTETFRKFKASNPEQWAESEIEEGIPQLARFLFLKGAWSNVVPDNDEWIQHILKNYDPTDNGPYSGMMHSIKEMIDAGVSKNAITEFARCIGAEMIFSMTYLMDDPEVVEDNEYVNWGLFITDDEGRPIKELSGLYESVLGTDPTGREMCPKNKIDPSNDLINA